MKRKWTVSVTASLVVKVILFTILFAVLFVVQHAFLYSGEIANGIYIKQIPFRFEYNIISSNGDILVKEMENAHGWMVVDQYIYGWASISSPSPYFLIETNTESIQKFDSQGELNRKVSKLGIPRLTMNNEENIAYLKYGRGRNRVYKNSASKPPWGLLIKAYLLMILTPLLLVALALLFQLLEKISSAKLFHKVCYAAYWLLGAAIIVAWSLFALTFFVYALPSIVIAVFLCALASRTSKYQEILRKKESRFYRIGIKVALGDILFSIPLGLTFLVLHFVTSS